MSTSFYLNFTKMLKWIYNADLIETTYKLPQTGFLVT